MDNNKIMTAEEFIKEHYEINVKNHFLGFDKNGSESYSDYAKRNPLKTLSEGFIDFAKYHVKSALEAASNNVQMKPKDNIEELHLNDDWMEVDRNSILNAYPETNIK